MTAKEFDALAKETFGNSLTPLGFTCQGSSRCTFYRKLDNDVYHFVMPDIGSRGAWYDLKVFPHSPDIDPLFQQRFPDDLGIPTDSWCYLSESDGVSITQQHFHCKTEEGFRREFTKKVSQLFIRVGIPYLNRFESVEDVLPVIRHSSFLGFALLHVGRRVEALAALNKEKERLQLLDAKNKDVSFLLGHINELLDRA
jgi:hypothetical protein